jgi:hypothetical protein
LSGNRSAQASAQAENISGAKLHFPNLRATAGKPCVSFSSAQIFAGTDQNEKALTDAEHGCV